MNELAGHEQPASLARRKLAQAYVALAMAHGFRAQDVASYVASAVAAVRGGSPLRISEVLGDELAAVAKMMLPDSGSTGGAP